VTVLGRFSVVISNDPRYEDGKTYDLVLDTGITPEPATVIPATIPAAPNATSSSEVGPSTSSDLAVGSESGVVVPAPVVSGE
jgi:hypothetical protein